MIIYLVPFPDGLKRTNVRNCYYILMVSSKGKQKPRLNNKNIDLLIYIHKNIDTINVALQKNQNTVAYR